MHVNMFGGSSVFFLHSLYGGFQEWGAAVLIPIYRNPYYRDSLEGTTDPPKVF